MPSLTDHHSSKLFKVLLIGDSGTGKTGSLVQLVEAGYKLRILDMDNGLDSLVFEIKQRCPDKLGSVEFETRRDRMKLTPSGPMTVGPAKAYTESVKLMDKWSDESVPAEWGEDYVFVLDSLTAFSDAAFAWARGLNPTAKDPRQWYGAAQESIKTILANLTGEGFQANVVVISHITYTEYQDHTIKGHPSAIGKALGPQIGRWFNHLLVAETKGTGTNIKRELRAVPSPMVDAKSPVASQLDRSMPLDKGIIQLIEKMKG